MMQHSCSKEMMILLKNMNDASADQATIIDQYFSGEPEINYRSRKINQNFVTSNCPVRLQQLEPLKKESHSSSP